MSPICQILHAQTNPKTKVTNLKYVHIVSGSKEFYHLNSKNQELNIETFRFLINLNLYFAFKLIPGTDPTPERDCLANGLGIAAISDTKKKKEKKKKKKSRRAELRKSQKTKKKFSLARQLW